MRFLISAVFAFSAVAFAQDDISGCFPEGLAKNQKILEDAGFKRIEAGDFFYEVIKYRVNGFSYWKSAEAYRYEKKDFAAYATCHTILKQGVPAAQKILIEDRANRKTVKGTVAISDFYLNGMMAEKMIVFDYTDGTVTAKFFLREEMNHTWTDRETDGRGGTHQTLKVQITPEGKVTALDFSFGAIHMTYGSEIAESQYTVTLDNNTDVSDLVVSPQPMLQMCYGQSTLIKVENKSSFTVDCIPTNGTPAQLKEKTDSYSFGSAFPSLLKLTPYPGKDDWYEMKQVVCE